MQRRVGKEALKFHGREREGEKNSSDCIASKKHLISVVSFISLYMCITVHHHDPILYFHTMVGVYSFSLLVCVCHHLKGI